MMFTRHISSQLAAHLDGQLDPRQARQVEIHLEKCPNCRAEQALLASGKNFLTHLPILEAPAEIWTSIETALSRTHSDVPHGHSWRRPGALQWASAALLLVILCLLAYWQLRNPRPTWEITRINGAASATGRVAPGDWIETNVSSRATLKIGSIGSLQVEPNTRLRVITELATEHRLALQHGEIHATISAPPKLFFVDTASGTAVDLGCEYSLRTDQDGAGVLRVTKGWVSFQWQGRESLVPAGASCRTYAHAGPAMPYFDDASEGLKQAVDNFGRVKSADGGLSEILQQARPRDTLTLWHLLWRVDPADRASVYDRIAALTPIPAGISRDQALKLDPGALTRLKDELAWTW